MKKQNGITLVALVITIIVLLILAGVSISLVVGNNGVLTQASNAVINNERATAFQEVQMAAADAETAYYGAWASNFSSQKKDFYNDSYFNLDNCPGATSVTCTASETNDGTVTIVYTAKSGNVYTFTISLPTGQVEVAANVEYDEFAIGDEVSVTVNGVKEYFYVLKNSGKFESTVTLMSKYALNKTANGNGHYMQLNALETQTTTPFSTTAYWATENWQPGMDLNAFTTQEIIDRYSLTKDNCAILRARDYAQAVGGVSGRLITDDEARALYSYDVMMFGKASSQGYIDSWTANLVYESTDPAVPGWWVWTVTGYHAVHNTFTTPGAPHYVPNWDGIMNFYTDVDNAISIRPVVVMEKANLDAE